MPVAIITVTRAGNTVTDRMATNTPGKAPAKWTLIVAPATGRLTPKRWVRTSRSGPYAATTIPIRRKVAPMATSAGTGRLTLSIAMAGEDSRLRRMSDPLRFPDGFLFGASISAYQTEGGNTNTDWWWWEHIESTPCREPSGDACDFYHRYREDIAMLASFGLNSFRFGIEWARIEPAEGEFSRAELAHYRRILDACHESGVAPIVTFQHFTVPRWLNEEGGIASEKFPALFERYCDRAAHALGDRIAYACTLNEPQGLGSSGWLLGINPPGHTDDREGAQRAVDNLLEAHRLGAPAVPAPARLPPRGEAA